MLLHINDKALEFRVLGSLQVENNHISHSLCGFSGFLDRLFQLLLAVLHGTEG